MIILVLGGTRSGKSVVAERLAEQSAAGDAAATVAYVATAHVDPSDADHAARIQRHRERRPSSWTTVECPDPTMLHGLLRAAAGTVLVDSLGTWVTGHPDLAAGLDPDSVADVVAALVERDGVTVVVSEEVGFAPHAPTELGRRFVDALGEVNQAVSAVADRALLVVAGRALELPPPPC